MKGGEVERVKGIEPSSRAWEACVLPLNYTRNLFGEVFSGPEKNLANIYFP